MSVCRSYLKFISLLIALADRCERKQLFLISLNCLVEVIYYLKKIFNFQYDKSVTTAEELPYFSLLLFKKMSAF